MGFRTDFETGLTYVPLKDRKPEKPVKSSAPKVKLVGPVVPESNIGHAQLRIIRAIYSGQRTKENPPLRGR